MVEEQIDALNTGSGFCTRATEYGKIDAISSGQSQTRFFAAANAVSQALADVATPVSGLLVSGQTASFFRRCGADEPFWIPFASLSFNVCRSLGRQIRSLFSKKQFISG